MKNTPPLPLRAARAVRGILVAIDPRALVALVSVAGVLAWLLPWQGLAAFFALACLIAGTAYYVLPGGRAALAAYGLFILLWVVSRLSLYLFEYPGAFGPALEGALLLGARLFALLGIAMAVPMAATPLTLGRTLSWYLQWLVSAETAICSLRCFRSRLRPFFAGGVWRAALALALMMAFFPRSFRALSALRRSLRLRAPNLALHRRFTLLGLAALRVLSAQTWDMALAIASRNLYRPEPWALRPKAEQ